MSDKERLGAAANVLIPAYLLLLQLGYEVRCEHSSDGRETWWATRAGLELWATDTLALLGLHCLHQERGANWKASDDQIAEFLQRFHGGGPG
jgi:hypothetical protein